jgi:MFS family permease
MFIQGQVQRLKGIYQEYPGHFWTLIGARFIDALGGALLFPFFTLYITSKFGVGMTQVGILFGVFTVSSIFGSTIGGALADRFGRKAMVIFGLIASATSALVMGFANSFQVFIGGALFVGLFASVGGPAGGAMIADLLPEEKRAQGYGVLRVMHNLAVTIGPAIGGFLATRSYLLLFIIDAVASLITALIVFVRIPETKPEATKEKPVETMSQTMRGYGKVVQDRRYMIFLLAHMLMAVVYMQMNGTLAVYLRDFHRVPAQGFGYILTLNAGMVVLFQFAITRKIEGRPPFLMMTLGTLLYVVGFSMYGFVSVYALFLVAMAIITMGEMLTAPVGQALAAQMAPDDMRGRYMAFYGFSWSLPNAVGFYLAGLILDNYDPRILWYAAGLVGLIATASFLAMHLQKQREDRVQARLPRLAKDELGAKVSMASET